MRSIRLIAAPIILGLGSCTTVTTAIPADPSPLIIAHRGASGLLPEHTLEAYDLAITQGADYIEPDLVSTKDGVLVARHENEIGGTTDVAERFPERRRETVIDGRHVSGWFTEDFTVAEIGQLRAKERLPFRSHANDGRFRIPTFDDVLTLVRRRERELGRRIGVYPETKHPSHFSAIGLPLEPALLASLERFGYRTSADAVFIQSFETANLRALRPRTTIRLVQLVDRGALPPDLTATGDRRSMQEFLSPDGLRAIAGWADAVGVEKHLVQPIQADGSLGDPTTLVRDAHAAGLAVHVWTLRSDTSFLPRAYSKNALAEWQRFAQLGVDGMFGDFPADGVRALRDRP